MYLIFKEREKECRKQIENAEHDLQNLHEKRAVIKDKLRTQTKGMRSNSTQHFLNRKFKSKLFLPRLKGTEETRKRLQTINKEVSALNDDVTKKELKLENVLGARHQVLVDARLNGVSLPLTQGTNTKKIVSPDFGVTDSSKSSLSK